MTDVCPLEQKLIDKSNFHSFEYKKGIDEDDLVSWDDGVRAWSDKEVECRIKHNNDEIKHLQSCEHSGCKEHVKLMKDCNLWQIYKNREDMLTGKSPLIRPNFIV